LKIKFGAIEPLLVDCIPCKLDIGSRGNVGIIDNKCEEICIIELM
jgi:hypothetical protein